MRPTVRGGVLRASVKVLGLVFATALGAQCAPVIKRDLSKVPVGQVGFDDLCGLQAYFDRLAMKIGTPPAVVSATELQGKGHMSGRATFGFETDFQLQSVRQVLGENWRRLPDQLGNAPRVEIEVQWSERAGVRRVVTDRDAELSVGRDRTSLPYHVCLSEFLFGEPLYQQRRTALGLGPLPTPPPLIATTAASGIGGAGGGAGARPDAGSSGAGGVGTDAASSAGHEASPAPLPYPVVAPAAKPAR